MAITETLWRQVHDSLREWIEGGGPQLAGVRLPSEPQLMAAHGVGSRTTINRAVRALMAEGLVDERRRVAERKLVEIRVSDTESLSWNEDMARAGHVTEPPEIEIELDGDWLVRKVLRRVDRQPHNWGRWRFRADIALGSRLAYREDIPEGAVRYLKEGLECTRLIPEKPYYDFRPATPEEARVLQMPAGEWVVVEHRAGSQDGTRIFDSDRILRAGMTRLIP